MIGAVLNDRYRLDAELGQGAMGAVYRAHDNVLDRAVAVKVLSVAALGSAGRARLLHEAQAIAQLDHPNIVSVYDAGESNGSPYLVMQLVEGHSLHDQPPHSLEETLSVIRQICAALDHAHAHGIVHRDLKPENILITPGGIVKLMDFGLARSNASRLTTEGGIVGTVFYLAPELALGQPFDGRADLYALGVILYELTTGRLPFTGDNPLIIISQHLHAPVIPPNTYNSEIPAVLNALIVRLMSKQPEDRPRSAQEVLEILSADAPLFPAPPAARHNLPVQLSSFIGREQELTEVRRLLSESRLVTLTGPAGCGKTRLALRVAADLMHASLFPDGVWLVELAPLSDPALVPQAVASAVDVSEQSGRPLLETLSGFLRSKQLLLVLDNCERLIDACARLAETLLRSCPSLKILATSREAIGLTGESAWLVPPMSMPDPRQLLLPEAEFLSALMQYESMRLFVDRALAAQPAFMLTIDNAPAVAQICYRLDGIPLAIELAAARMKALSVEQIVTRLDDRFNLLTVGSRTALPQHQTLRATIDWSYDLLSEKERSLFCQLAVFASDWALEAAEAVCTDELQPLEVVDLLTQLVNRSLVMLETQGRETRYRYLETIRQYAREKLLESGKNEAARGGHVAFFLKLAEEAEPKLRGVEQVVWLDRLEAEHDNLRAALAWALAQREIEAGLRLAGSLYRFWYLRGYWREGREWLERMLSGAGTGDFALARARALYGAGWLSDENGQEVLLYSESLALCQANGDKWGAAFSLRGLGVSACLQGDYEQGDHLLNESLALFREIADKWGMALALFNLGWSASDRDDQPQAEAWWNECLALFRQAGDRWGIAVSLNALRFIARLQSDDKRVVMLSKESLALFRQLGDKAGIANSLVRLGDMALQRDDFKQTAMLFEESLALQRELGYRSDVATSLSILGLVVCYQGEYPRASALLEESLALWREIEDQWGIAQALSNLGFVAYCRADLEPATTLWEESLGLFRIRQYKAGIATALLGLGQVAERKGDYGRATTLLEESLGLYRETEKRQGVAISLNGLGKVACSQHDTARALALYQESLRTRRGSGAKRVMAISLEGLASIAGLQGHMDRAAQLFGAAAALRATIGAPLPPIDRADYEQDVAAVRAQLDAATFQTAWEAGYKMALDKTLEFALKDAGA